jgi:hypothetical protein
MTYKIIYHIMPWEIDYALLSFTQLKKSKYHLSEEDNVTIETVLNLSSYTINWGESKLPKEFFIEKYNQISTLLEGYTHIKHVYEGDQLYGHLDLQRECISPKIDFYLSICPDIYFSEHALSYLIEASKQIDNKYFTITTQISKVGDADWDEITNSKYVNIPYSDYLEVDIFDVMHNNRYNEEEKSLHPTKKSKWAGWFDLYNKALYEELCPSQEDWKGYGPWDLYSLILTNHLKSQGVDFQQYLIQGETIWMYPSGPLAKNGLNGFAQYYKDFLQLNPIPNQRQEFESKLNEYLQRTINQLKTLKIL